MCVRAMSKTNDGGVFGWNTNTRALRNNFGRVSPAHGVIAMRGKRMRRRGPVSWKEVWCLVGWVEVEGKERKVGKERDV